MDEIADNGAVVFGASVDSVDSHRAFANKYGLDYPLLADTDGELSAALGVLRKVGPLKISARVTFVFSADGKVVRVFDPVIPVAHAEEVVGVLRGLRQG